MAGNGPGISSSPRRRMPSNLRNEVSKCVSMTWRVIRACPWMEGTTCAACPLGTYSAGWCKLKGSETCVESAWFRRLKLKYMTICFQVLLSTSTCAATTRVRSARRRATLAPWERPRQASERPTWVNAFAPPTPSSTRKAPRASATPASRVTSTRPAASALRAQWRSTRKSPAPTSAARAPSVGRCKLKPVETRVESAWFQRLKLNCDKPVSEFAFKFNLRPYTSAPPPPPSAPSHHPRACAPPAPTSTLLHRRNRIAPTTSAIRASCSWAAHAAAEATSPRPSSPRSPGSGALSPTPPAGTAGHVLLATS